jgi:cell division protein FtsB
MTSPTAPEVPKRKYSPKLLAGIALAAALGVSLVFMCGYRGPLKMFLLRQERVHLEQENARLMAENARLARTIDRLQHDPEFIQGLIRQELNFVKKNEVIFQLPPDGLHTKTGVQSAVTAAVPSLGRHETGKVAAPEKKHWLWDILERARQKVTGLMSQGAKG